MQTLLLVILPKVKQSLLLQQIHPKGLGN
uniref:Uncharacterized protein n=1 Tax=Arundo donax TaxID=35708 RepID=A0A0A9H5F1_ARUDO